MQSGVLADKGDRDSLKDTVLANSKTLPFLPDHLTLLDELGILRNRVNVQQFLDSVEEALLLQENRHLVSGRHVVNSDDLIPLHLARIGDFLDGALFKRGFAATGDQIRPETSTANIANGSLGRLGLLLRADQRDVADVDLQEVVLAGPPLELTHRLHKRCAFNVSNSTAQLDDANVGFPP